MRTKERLAAELRKVGLDELAERAEHGDFDDYESPLAAPQVSLYILLLQAGQHEFAKRVERGEFEATDEEAKEWYEREGRAIVERLCESDFKTLQQAAGLTDEQMARFRKDHGV